MEIKVKRYSELSRDEIYEILKARARIFVVEKGMTCLDPDGRDKDCLHAMLYDGDALMAYFRAEKFSGYVKLGRVITLKHGLGYGKMLLLGAEGMVAEMLGNRAFMVHSMCDARGFYERLGYTADGEEYLEENIPHITMLKNIEKG